MLCARRFDRALAQLRRAIELEPRFFMPVMFAGDCHRFAGRPEEASALYERAMELVGREPILLGRRASAAAEQGDRALAERILQELESLAPSRFVLPSIPARAFLSLGDLDRGFEWLERAVDARDTSLAILPVWPGYDRARPDPRYPGLLDRVGLWPGPGVAPVHPPSPDPR